VCLFKWVLELLYVGVCACACVCILSACIHTFGCGNVVQVCGGHS